MPGRGESGAAEWGMAGGRKGRGGQHNTTGPPLLLELLLFSQTTISVHTSVQLNPKKPGLHTHLDSKILGHVSHMFARLAYQ